jgi:hypothetical protein
VCKECSKFINIFLLPSTTITFNHYIYCSSYELFVFLLVTAKALISPINGDKKKIRVQVKNKCAVSASATVRVKKSRLERNTECKSETLGFVGLY